MLMQMGTSTRLYLSQPLAAGLSGAETGAARILTDGEDSRATLTIYDTFDTQIMGSGQLLAAIGAELVLIPAEGAPLVQPGAAPGFVQDMQDGEVTARLGAIVDPLRRLLPLARGELVRARLKMVDDLEKTVARAREWRFETEDGRRAAMIECLPVRGYDDELAQLQALVAARGTTMADSGALGHALIGPEALYTSKPLIPMTPSDSAFSVANAFLATNLDVARRNEPGVIEDLDTEFLHDYRVALRRIRSVLSLFKGVYSPEQTDRLKARFSALMAETGRLRDLDVYMLERDAYADLVPEPFRPGIARLFAGLASDREAVQKSLAALFESEAYLKEVRSLQKLLANPKRLKPGPAAEAEAFGFAQKLIWKRYRKVCGIAAEIDDDTPDEQVHELRIQCKKLRYLIEFFTPLFDDDGAKKVLKSLKKLQNTLGDFNDYSVQQAELGNILDQLDPRSPDAIESAAGIGALVMALNRKQLEVRGKVVASFEAFDAPETRDLARALFKPRKSAT